MLARKMVKVTRTVYMYAVAKMEILLEKATVHHQRASNILKGQKPVFSLEASNYVTPFASPFKTLVMLWKKDQYGIQG